MQAGLRSLIVTKQSSSDFDFIIYFFPSSFIIGYYSILRREFIVRSVLSSVTAGVAVVTADRRRDLDKTDESRRCWADVFFSFFSFKGSVFH